MGLFKETDPKRQETRAAAFRAGMWLAHHDDHRGANEGLNDREIDALAEENTSIWGGLFKQGAIRGRAEEAQRRSKKR